MSPRRPASSGRRSRAPSEDPQSSDEIPTHEIAVTQQPATKPRTSSRRSLKSVLAPIEDDDDDENENEFKEGSNRNDSHEGEAESQKQEEDGDDDHDDLTQQPGSSRGKRQRRTLKTGGVAATTTTSASDIDSDSLHPSKIKKVPGSRSRRTTSSVAAASTAAVEEDEETEDTPEIGHSQSVAVSAAKMALKDLDNTDTTKNNDHDEKAELESSTSQQSLRPRRQSSKKQPSTVSAVEAETELTAASSLSASEHASESLIDDTASESSTRGGAYSLRLRSTPARQSKSNISLVENPGAHTPSSNKTPATVRRRTTAASAAATATSKRLLDMSTPKRALVFDSSNPESSEGNDDLDNEATIKKTDKHVDIKFKVEIPGFSPDSFSSGAASLSSSTAATFSSASTPLPASPVPETASGASLSTTESENAERRAATTSTTNSSATARQQALTTSYEDAPSYLREPYVYHGYRVPSESYAKSIYSLFYFHNALGDIYSHLLAFIAYAYLAYITLAPTLSSWLQVLLSSIQSAVEANNGEGTIINNFNIMLQELQTAWITLPLWSIPVVAECLQILASAGSSVSVAVSTTVPPIFASIAESSLAAFTAAATALAPAQLIWSQLVEVTVTATTATAAEAAAKANVTAATTFLGLSDSVLNTTSTVLNEVSTHLSFVPVTQERFFAHFLQLPQPLPSSDAALFLLYFTGVLLCFGFSTAYHIFGSHSARVHDLFYRLDQCGIVSAYSVSIMFLIHFTYVDTYSLDVSAWVHTTVNMNFIIIVLLSTFLAPSPFVENKSIRDESGASSSSSSSSSVVSGTSNNGQGIVDSVSRLSVQSELPSRVVALSLMFLAGLGSVLHIYLTTTVPWGVIAKFLLTYFLYAIGLVLFVTRWPERSFPGRFDYLFKSHQLWHLFVMAGAFNFYPLILEHYHWHLQAHAKQA